ncbi:hypothetical protein [Paraburkholderia kirstenboschensis]|uniref:Uncharacterized protein n=1 Tax=Paraburkholderia kirstenboschensis TaxID=1245436 RepID=A0ABZ0EEW4_9BURK|nr:hypothetical protein [Paraburkholderia kirstenboschensis]WOD14777.1 hypothetical protein RW095_01235 [Paraburkholderia kirstenboschensis]
MKATTATSADGMTTAGTADGNTIVAKMTTDFSLLARSVAARSCPAVACHWPGHQHAQRRDTESGRRLLRSRQCLELLLYMAVLAWTGASASGIECAATRRPAERVICNHAIVNDEYNGNFAQQQALLSSGNLSPRQLAQRRHVRNANTDVCCIGTVPVQWKTKAEPVEAKTAAAAAPGMAAAPNLASVGPTSGAGVVPPEEPNVSAAAASTTYGASLTRQGTQASAALLQPAASNTLSPRVISSASSAYDARRERRLAAALILLILIAIPLSAFVIHRNKKLGITTNYRRSRVKKKR